MLTQGVRREVLHMLHLTSTNFEAELNSPLPVIVMFYAAWCGKCAMMKPVIEDIEKKYQKKVRFFLMDVDKCEKLAADYGADIVPTFLFFKNGQPTGFMQGVISQTQFEQRLKKIFRIS